MSIWSEVVAKLPGNLICLLRSTWSGGEESSCGVWLDVCLLAWFNKGDWLFRGHPGLPVPYRYADEISQGSQNLVMAPAIPSLSSGLWAAASSGTTCIYRDSARPQWVKVCWCLFCFFFYLGRTLLTGHQYILITQQLNACIHILGNVGGSNPASSKSVLVLLGKTLNPRLVPLGWAAVPIGVWVNWWMEALWGVMKVLVRRYISAHI